MAVSVPPPCTALPTDLARIYENEISACRRKEASLNSGAFDHTRRGSVVSASSTSLQIHIKWYSQTLVICGRRKDKSIWDDFFIRDNTFLIRRIFTVSGWDLPIFPSLVEIAFSRMSFARTSASSSLIGAKLVSAMCFDKTSWTLKTSYQFNSPLQIPQRS